MISSGAAIGFGMVIALFCGNPLISRTRKLTKPLLSLSIIGLGAGMDLMVVARVGLSGIGFTAVALSITAVVGWLIGRMLKIEKTISLLVVVGTAICGGSAIAAVSSAVRAKEYEISVSLAIVFILNAVVLWIFPPIGHLLNLTQHQFGLWAALAIHDTSSVVGATLQYGPEALQIGTTVKLVRALWIIPVTLIVGRFFVPEKQADGVPAPKRTYPTFILGFLLASALVTWIPELRPGGHVVEMVAKHTLTGTLFLIGAGLTRETLRKVGFAPLAQGVLLWLIVGLANLGAILAGAAV